LQSFVFFLCWPMRKHCPAEGGSMENHCPPM
jgi:hypothetical protein